jgi:hypothetical protein
VVTAAVQQPKRELGYIMLAWEKTQVQNLNVIAFSSM